MRLKNCLQFRLNFTAQNRKFSFAGKRFAESCLPASGNILDGLTPKRSNAFRCVDVGAAASLKLSDSPIKTSFRTTAQRSASRARKLCKSGARFPRFRHDSDARHARFRGSGATGGPDSPDSARRTSDRTAPRQPARNSPRAASFNGLIFVSCYALNWERRLGSKRWIKRNFRIGCRLRTGRPRRSGRRRPVRFRPTRTRRDRSLRWSGASANRASARAARGHSGRRTLL